MKRAVISIMIIVLSVGVGVYVALAANRYSAQCLEHIDRCLEHITDGDMQSASEQMKKVLSVWEAHEYIFTLSKGSQRTLTLECEIRTASASCERQGAKDAYVAVKRCEVLLEDAGDRGERRMLNIM